MISFKLDEIPALAPYLKDYLFMHTMEKLAKLSDVSEELLEHIQDLRIKLDDGIDNALKESLYLDSKTKFTIKQGDGIIITVYDED